MRFTLALAALVTLAAPAAAQQASYTFFGTGCSPTGAYYYAPTMTVQGLPRLGQSFTVVYSGPNSCAERYCVRPLLLTGVSNASWGGLSLPYHIPNSYGAQIVFGCVLRVSPDLLIWMPPLQPPSTFPAWEDRVAFFVPNVPSLLGLSFYQQWLAIDSFSSGGTQVHSMFSTRGGHAVIGT